MMSLDWIFMYLSNLASASMLCKCLSLIAGALWRGLPKQRASLVLGLAIAGVLLFACTQTTAIIFAQVPVTSTDSPSRSAVAKDATEGQGSKLAEFGKAEFPANKISGTILLADGKPAGNAVLRIVGHRLSAIDALLNADSTGRFAFSVRFPTEALGQLQFSAQTADGSELAFHRFAWKSDELITEEINIKLQPTRTAEVEVVDGQGQPIAGARVVVQLAYPNTLEGSETNAMGKSSIKLPVTERIGIALAWKDHAGLDYKLYQLSRYAQADIKAVLPEFPTDQPERLILNGAQPVTVSVIDSANDKPVTGAEIAPWVLTKDQDPEGLNLSFFDELIAQPTTAEGTTTFAWMPAWQKAPVIFWPNADGYESPRATYDPSIGRHSLRIALHRLVTIRGHVVDSDGQPVEGAQISAKGNGRAFNEFRAAIRTDETGSYEIKVAPNHNYLLTAKDEHRVSAPHTGLIVYPNTPIEDRDFKLRSPTRVHGRLLNERTQEPIAKERVIVYHYGTELMEIPGANIPNPDDERYSVRPIIQHYAWTNEEGRFEFLLGDGNFDLRPPQQEKAEKFEIKGQEELEFTVTTKVHAQVELLGLVLAKSDRQPINGARVLGVPRDFGSMDWTATADEEGKFRVLRRQEPTYVRVTNDERTLACIVEVGELNRTFVFLLEPVGKALGRLVNRDGEPIAGQQIRFNVDVPDVNNHTWSPRFGGTATTNDRGEFHLDGLVANWEYKATFPSTPQGAIPRLTKVTVKPGETIDLGDVTEPAR